MTKEPILVSPQLISAVHRVWDAIAPDAGEFVESNADAVEMCIDADRLLTFSSAADNEEVKALMKAHGYAPVFAAICNKVYLA